MITKTKRQYRWKNSGYLKRKYKRSFEVKQLDKLFDYNVAISEHRTYEDIGDTEWYGGVSINPDYLGSFIDDLKNRRAVAKASGNRVLTLKWSKGTATISDDKMAYYRVYKVKADAQKLIQELEKFHQKWTNRDHQLDLFEWARNRILEK